MQRFFSSYNNHFADAELKRTKIIIENHSLLYIWS